MAFHPHFFSEGALLIASGGIPGCPETLTQIQRDECRAPAGDLAGFMTELHRQRMLHRGENMAHDGTPREGQTFSFKQPQARSLGVRQGVRRRRTFTKVRSSVVPSSVRTTRSGTSRRRREPHGTNGCHHSRQRSPNCSSPATRPATTATKTSRIKLCQSEGLHEEN